MAEAALRGMTTVGDAETWYNLGIDASMTQWGISGADALSYKSQPTVAYDASKGLELIATQKWASLYLQGSEAWSEWRRLDFPKLEPAEAALSGNGIPNHEVGTFPNPDNPNTITEQNVNANFPLCPTIISESGQPVGGQAGTIAGGAFLKEFVNDTPWVHFDIAGTAWQAKDQPYIPSGPSGVGVRLSLELLNIISSS